MTARCYSDHNEDVRTKGACDHCGGTETETPVSPTMTTEEMRELYDVQGFLAPYVVVYRKADGQRGSLQFTHSPRTYFGWVPDVEETR